MAGHHITVKVFTMLLKAGKGLEERLEEWETRKLSTGHLDTWPHTDEPIFLPYKLH